jgi:hypothetical protein
MITDAIKQEDYSDFILPISGKKSDIISRVKDNCIHVWVFKTGQDRPTQLEEIIHFFTENEPPQVHNQININNFSTESQFVMTEVRTNTLIIRALNSYEFASQNNDRTAPELLGLRIDELNENPKRIMMREKNSLFPILAILVGSGKKGENILFIL